MQASEPAQITAAQPTSPAAFRTGGVITISLAHFIHDTYSAFFAPLLPLLIANLAITKTAAGLLQVFYQGPSLLQPLIGHLGDRTDLRLLVVLSPTIAAIMFTLIGVAPGYGLLVLLLIVAGFNSAGLHAIGPVITGLESGRQLGRGMSFWTVGGELGRTLGPLIVVGAVSLVTLRGLPWLIAGGLIASTLLAARMHGLQAYQPAGPDRVPTRQALSEMRPVLLPMLGVVLARAMLFSSVVTFLPTLLTDEGAPLWLAGAAFSVMQAAGVAGAFSGGLISDRLGRRRVMALMSLAAPLAVLLFLVAHGWAQFPLLAVVGFTLLSTTPVMMALVQERATQSRALANGFFMAMNLPTQSLGVLLVGILGDAYGLRMAFQVSAFVMLAGLPFVLGLPGE